MNFFDLLFVVIRILSGNERYRVMSRFSQRNFFETIRRKMNSERLKIEARSSFLPKKKKKLQQSMQAEILNLTLLWFEHVNPFSPLQTYKCLIIHCQKPY